MLRKISTITAMAAVLSAAACNSISGVDGTSPVTGNRNGGQTKQPQYSPPGENPRCIDDLRAVEITSPAEAQVVHNGEIVMITWDVQHFCTGFTSEVEVSYDGGLSFSSFGRSKNVESWMWRLPELDGLRPVLRVTVSDAAGALVAEQALGFTYRVSGGRPIRGQQHD